MFIQIVAPHFVAGIDIEGKERRVAPIIKYMKDWPIEKILGYCRKKNWEVYVDDDRPY